MSPGQNIQIMAFLWRAFLRDLLKEAVDKTDNSWDDRLLEVIDEILGLLPHAYVKDR